jgi:DNA-directed RNA polymerase subunit N (RpoN/RPB10)
MWCLQLVPSIRCPLSGKVIGKLLFLRALPVSGKVMGGTSVLNGMMFIRGHRQDFDDWAAAGNTGWDYKSVLTYFLKSEDNLQIGDVYKKVGLQAYCCFTSRNSAK